MRKFLCILMCMMMVLAFMPTMAFATKAPATKIEVSVTSGDATLTAKVNEDYVATVNLPEKTDTFDKSSVKAVAIVTGLQKLGMASDAKKTHTIDVNRGTAATATVAAYFDRVYKFDDRTVNINVEGKKVSYTVKYGEGDMITAKPVVEANAAAAWEEFANHVTLSTIVDNGYKAYGLDSVKVDNNGKATFNFKEGSYVQIGESKLVLDGYKATVTVEGFGLKTGDAATLQKAYTRALNQEKDTETLGALKNLFNDVKVEKTIEINVDFEKVYHYYPGYYVAPQTPEKTLEQKIQEAEDQLNAAIDDNVFKARSAKQTKLHGKKAVKVSWNKVEGADGYEVFRSTKKYSGFGTKPYFTTTKTTYTNNKELKVGKTYYYKVRAYKLVEGKKAYSDWSLKAWRTIK